MGFTYTDSDKKILEAWGKFKVTLLEAVEPGDLLNWYNNDNAYTARLADAGDEYRADCIAIDKGAAGAEITACLKAEVKTISTIATGGVVTRVYFAALADFLGAPVYLGESGKPASSAGTLNQQIGRLIARDRLMLDMTGANVYDSPTFTGTATFEGPVVMEGVLGVAGQISIASDSKLQFRDENAYIYSYETGVILIRGSGGTEGFGIYLHGNVQISGSITSLVSINMTGGSTGLHEINLKTNFADALSIRISGGADLMVFNTVGGNQITISAAAIMCTGYIMFSGDAYITTGKKLYCGSGSNGYIEGNAAGQVTIRSNATSSEAIILTTPNPNGIFLNGLVKFGTNAGSVEGQWWFNTSTKKFQFYNGSAVETVTSAT